MTCGFEDAALTALSNGVLASLREVFLVIFGKYFKIKERPEILFQSIYGRDFWEAECNFIFKIRIGNIIAAAWSMVKAHSYFKGGKTR